MRTVRLVATAAVVLCLLAPGGARAQGVDHLILPILLNTLPDVDQHVLDQDGHLTLLTGRLAEGGGLPAHATALRFVEQRPDLYPRAEDSTLAIGWWAEAGDEPTRIGIYQLVGGFEAVDDGITCAVDREGVLIRVEGMVLHDGDLPVQTGTAISEAAAIDIALREVPEAGSQPPTPAVHPVLFGTERRRALQVDIAWEEDTSPTVVLVHRSRVFVDAFSGSVLGEEDEDITDLALAFGDLSAPEPPNGVTPPPPTNCVPYGDPPGNFTTLFGFEQWEPNSWTGWSFVPGVPTAEYQASAYPKCGSRCYGLISRTEDHLTPTGHSLLRLTFPSVGTAMGATLRFNATGNGVRFEVEENTTQPTYVFLDLGRNLYWWNETPVNGFYSRKFALEIHTPMAHGQISKVDIFPGGNLIFSGDPMFLIDGELAYSFGSNVSRLELHHNITNVGCDLLSPHDTARRIQLTMCKASDPGTCRNDLLTCKRHLPPGETRIGGDTLLSGESRWNELCHWFGLPPADPPSNLTQWKIEGTFEDMPPGGGTGKQTDATFTLVAHGIPNLKVSPVETVEVWEPVGEDLERLETLQRGQTFWLLFGVQSQQYVAYDVPVQVKLCARPPAPMTERPCLIVADGVLPTVGTAEGTYQGVSVENLSLGSDLLPDPEMWTTLDVEITVDPNNQIVEYHETDNGLEVPSWITLSVGDLDGAIGGLISADGFGLLDPQLPLQSPFASSMWWNVRYDFLDAGVLGPAPDDPWPHLGWQVDGLAADTRVTGALLRYRRVVNGSTTPALSSGEKQGVYATCAGFDHDSEVNLIHDGQWHLAFWRDDAASAPFGGLSVSNLEAVGTSSSETSVTYYLEPDKGCIPRGWANCDYPKFELDFIRLYGGVHPQPAWDAAPYRLVYFNTADSTWYQLPSTVSPLSAWRLGVLVAGVSAAHPVNGSQVQVTREAPLGTIETLVVTDQVAEGPSAAIYAFEDSGGPSTWVPGSSGEWLFRVNLVNVGDTNPSNDQKDFTVQVGCATALTLPTAVTQ